MEDNASDTDDFDALAARLAAMSVFSDSKTVERECDENPCKWRLLKIEVHYNIRTRSAGEQAIVRNVRVKFGTVRIFGDKQAPDSHVVDSFESSNLLISSVISSVETTSPNLA